MSAPSSVPFDLNGDGFHDFRAVQTGRDSIRFERWTIDRRGLGSWQPTWLDPQEVYAWLVDEEDEGNVSEDNVLRRWLTERDFPAGDPVVAVDGARSPLGAPPGVAPWFPGIDGDGRPQPASAFGALAGLGGDGGAASKVDRSLSLRLTEELDALQRTAGGQQSNWAASASFRFQDHRAFRSLGSGSKQLLEGLLAAIATYPASEGWTAVVNLARLLEDGSLGDDWGAALLWELDEVASERGVDDLVLLALDEATLRLALTHGVAAPKYLDPEGSTARVLLDHVVDRLRRSSGDRSVGDWFRAVSRSGGTGGRELWWLAGWPAGEHQAVSPHVDVVETDDPAPVRWRSHVPSGRVNHVRLVAAIARLADHDGEVGGAGPMVLATLLDAAGYWPVEVITATEASDDALVVAGRRPGSAVADPDAWGDHWVVLHTGGAGAIATDVEQLTEAVSWYTPGLPLETLGAFPPRANAQVRAEPRGRGPATTEWVWWNTDARPRLPATSARPPSLHVGCAPGSHWMPDPVHGWILLGPDDADDLVVPPPRDDFHADGSPPPMAPPAPYDVVVWNDRRWVWTGATWRVDGSPPPIRRAGFGAEVTWLGAPWSFDGAVWSPRATANARPSIRHRWDGASWVKPPADESLADLLGDRLVVLDPGDLNATPVLADAEPLPPLPEPEPEPELEVELEPEVVGEAVAGDAVDHAADTADEPGDAHLDAAPDGDGEVDREPHPEPVLTAFGGDDPAADVLTSAHASTIQGPRPAPKSSSARRVGAIAAAAVVIVAVVAALVVMNRDDDAPVASSSTTSVDDGAGTTTSVDDEADTTTTPSSTTISGGDTVAEPAYRTIPLLDGYDFAAPPVLLESPPATQVTAGPEGTSSDPHLQYSWLAIGDVDLSASAARQLSGVVGNAVPGRYNVLFQQVAGDARQGGRYQAGFWLTSDPVQLPAPDGVHVPENRLRGLIASVSFDETNETLTVYDDEYEVVDDSGVFATVAPRIRTLWIPRGDVSFVHMSRFVRFTEPDTQPDFSDPASYTLQPRPFVLGGASADVEVEAGTSSGIGARHDGNTHWFFDSQRILRLVRTYDRCADDGMFWLFLSEQAFTDIELVLTDSAGQVIRRPPGGDLSAPVIEPVAFTACGG